MSKVIKHKTTDLPRQTGEVARIRTIRGPDLGTVFVITDSSVTIGRGEECDLQIRDLKSSRSHARLDYTNDGWVMNDLGSANGIFFQGEYIRKFALKNGDHFTLGDSIFEFLASHELAKLPTAPLKDGEEVARQDEALARQKIRIQNLGKAVKTGAAGGAGKKKTNPRTLILLAAGAGLYFYMDSMEQKAPPPKPKKVAADGSNPGEDGRTLASYLPGTVSKDVEKTADQYYWQGFREYTKGNYLRAKDSFSLALQVDPNHEKARHYLASAEKENTDEIKRLLESGNKAKLVGHYTAARGYYETAMRHLYNDKENPDYIECEEALKALDERSKAGGS